MKEKNKRTPMDAALFYLGIRSRSEHELKAYLHKKKYSDPEIEETLQRLAELGYVNDRRFAKELMDSMISLKNASHAQISAKLYAAGISKENAAAALSEYSRDEEIDSLSRVAEKLMKQYSNLDPDERILKIKRRLFSRGFSYDLIAKYFSQTYGDEFVIEEE